MLLTKDKCSNHGELLYVLRALEVLEYFHKKSFTEGVFTPNPYLAGIQISQGHSYHLPVLAKLSRLPTLLQLDTVREADLFHSWVKQLVVPCDRWRWLKQVMKGVDEDLEAITVLGEQMSIVVVFPLQNVSMVVEVWFKLTRTYVIVVIAAVVRGLIFTCVLVTASVVA